MSIHITQQQIQLSQQKKKKKKKKKKKERFFKQMKFCSVN